MKNLNISNAVVLASLGCAVVIGCNNDFDDKPKANVNAATSLGAVSAELQKAATASAVSPQFAQLSGVWPLDASQSEVGFEGAKVTGKHVGSFKKIDGKVSVTSGRVNALTVTIDMTSVESDNEKLTGHLKSPDFFDIEKFPEATFVSTSVVEKAAGGATHEVTGNLFLHGVTKSITFPATVTADKTSAKGTAEFTINRKDFNIIYPGKPDDLIKDEVLLKLKLVFNAAAAGAPEAATAAGSAAAPADAKTDGAVATGTGAAASVGVATSADLGAKVKDAADKANNAIQDVAKAAENATGSDVDKAAAALKAASEKAKEAADKLTKPAKPASSK